MKTFTRIGLYGLMVGMALITPAMAKGGKGGGGGKGGKHEQGGHKGNKHKGKDHDKGNKGNDKEDEWVIDQELDKRLRRSDVDLDRVRVWARESSIQGLGELPPGIRKGLLRGKPLPPGIERRTLAPEFTSKLPVYDGYEWQGYGQDLILYNTKERIIADVLSGIFR